MAIDFKLIGNRIQQRRKDCGKTQQDLADEIYVSAGYISQIERGITKVNLETLSDIADILECDIADLLSMSNLFHNKDIKREEFLRIYNQLSIEERELLHQLVSVYISKR